MHGEYKPPGGKVVAADVEVADGRLGRVQVSGDFFLEPGDALDRVNAALTGIPVDADTSVITTRVKATLGSDAMLAGFTAGAVATAVRRALVPASAVKHVDPLRRQTRLSRAEIIDTLTDHFRRRYGLTPDAITGGELRAARELARAKFSSSEWTAWVS